ncbi:MAG: serine hydrolase [Candidatus Jorgensenbacteria bacterium]|nr:serine hydrolase [Candidatus Jorgensenbacteria bacterium]
MRFYTIVALVLAFGTLLVIGMKSFLGPVADSASLQNNSASIGIAGGALSPADPDPAPKLPVRKWDVFDPQVNAEAVLIKSLDEDFLFFSYNTYKPWPMASLTKLLTAVVVIENIGVGQKIPVSETAVGTEGEAGGLRSGEVYAARDLLKIMLMTSSNDAAAAFEEYAGGKEALAKLLNDKAAQIGMTGTVVYDGSGLSDSNVSSASDIAKLVRYVMEYEPEILSWTRVQTMMVQPANDATGKQITNIDPLVTNSDFLGGKTGTSPLAKENLASVFSFFNGRVAVIILGSTNRVQEVDSLFSWVKQAYESR